MGVTVADRAAVEAARSRRTARGLVVILAGAAWLALGTWSASPYGRYLSHHGLAEPGASGTSTVGLFVAGWVLMLAAMMFPSTHELVATFSVVVRNRPNRVRLLLGLLTGYVAVWTTVGLAALLGDKGLHEAVHRAAWLEANAWAISATVLAAAGLYQFSPIKDRCLAECRSPRSFVFARWRGRNPLAEAFLLGAGHGRFCVGCCIALMLLMFALGIGSLGWMLALGAVMTVEKVAPWGRRIVAPVGVALPLVAVEMVLANV